MEILKQYEGKYRNVVFKRNDDGKYMVLYNLKGYESNSYEISNNRYEECLKECKRFEELMEGKY